MISARFLMALSQTDALTGGKSAPKREYHCGGKKHDSQVMFVMRLFYHSEYRCLNASASVSSVHKATSCYAYWKWLF